MTSTNKTSRQDDKQHQAPHSIIKMTADRRHRIPLSSNSRKLYLVVIAVTTVCLVLSDFCIVSLDVVRNVQEVGRVEQRQDEARMRPQHHQQLVISLSCAKTEADG